MVQLFANNTISGLYVDQLKKEHDGTNWGSTGGKYSGADVLTIMANRPYIQTALDYGAGKGSLGKLITSRFDVKWTNYDPGIPEYDKLPSGRFDLVTCTDVMEHVEPERVTEVLRTLADRCAKVLYLDIACTPTGKLFTEGPYAGQDLHLIVEDPLWWRNKIKEAGLGGFVEVMYHWREHLAKGKMKTRATFIYERV